MANTSMNDEHPDSQATERRLDALLPLVYGELRAIAHGRLRRERHDHTLGTTAHDALERLGTTNPRQARVVEYRFFGGMTEEEIAEALSITARTVRRDWLKAREWLLREVLGEGQTPQDDR
jgi:RNA polymerase sigma factor (sigma-70 family)